MFFRRPKPIVLTFQDRLDALKPFQIATQAEGGRVRVSRTDIAAYVTDKPDCPHVEKAGLVIGNEIAALVNGGYQQYWLTPGGKRLPAQAAQLRNLHAFEEDLKEGLGLTSLYNTSLGTTSSLHLYDRVEERDAVHARKPCEIRQS